MFFFLIYSSPNLVQHLIQPATMSGSQSICITPVTMQNYSNVVSFDFSDFNLNLDDMNKYLCSSLYFFSFQIVF